VVSGLQAKACACAFLGVVECFLCVVITGRWPMLNGKRILWCILTSE